MSNPCIRCGKQRINGRVWTEMVGQALVTHTQTVCPDADCQKIVDEEFTKARQKKESLMIARRNRLGKNINDTSSNAAKKIH